MYTPKSDVEIATIAKGIYQGTHFSSIQIDPSESPSILKMVFMPLVFMDKDQLQELVDDRVCHFYGEIEPGNRGVNGYPCMFNMGTLTLDDATKLYNKVNEIHKAVDDL
jgi:hypothetical protein